MPARSSALRSSTIIVAAVALAAVTTMTYATVGRAAPRAGDGCGADPHRGTGDAVRLEGPAPGGEREGIAFTPPRLTGDGSSVITLWASVRGATSPHPGPPAPSW